jgi:hypothetical protein
MAQFGFRDGISLDGVNPELAKLMSLAAASYNDPNISRVMVTSGKREGDPRQHGKGNAVDIQLFDKDGNPIPNYQDSKNFSVYQNFANHVRSVQSQAYPELNKDLRWGGYFSGPLGKGGSAKPMDLMHFDLAGQTVGPTLAGNLDNGLSPEWAKQWGINNSAPVSGTAVASNASVAAPTATGTGSDAPSRISALLDQQGWNPYAKAAILASMKAESNFNPLATNNNGERSFGLNQWNGPRQDALRAYAQANGLDPSSIEAQVGYLGHELNTTEGTAGNALRSASDLDSANAAMRQYERYGNGDAEQARRLALAQGFYNGTATGSGTSTAVADNSATPSQPTQTPEQIAQAKHDANAKRIGNITNALEKAFPQMDTVGLPKPPEQTMAMPVSPLASEGNPMAPGGGKNTQYAALLKALMGNS